MHLVTNGFPLHCQPPRNATCTAKGRNSRATMKGFLPGCSLTSKVDWMVTLSSLSFFLVAARVYICQPWAPDAPGHLWVLSVISQGRRDAFSVNRGSTGRVISPGNKNGNRSGGRLEHRLLDSQIYNISPPTSLGSNGIFL